MVILDQLGSKVWGQLIDPVQAFQTIINSVSYNNEIKNIRSSFKRSVLLRDQNSLMILIPGSVVAWSRFSCQCCLNLCWGREMASKKNQMLPTSGNEKMK